MAKFLLVDFFGVPLGLRLLCRAQLHLMPLACGIGGEPVLCGRGLDRLLQPGLIALLLLLLSLPLEIHLYLLRLAGLGLRWRILLLLLQCHLRLLLLSDPGLVSGDVLLVQLFDLWRLLLVPLTLLFVLVNVNVRLIVVEIVDLDIVALVHPRVFALGLCLVEGVFLNQSLGATDPPVFEELRQLPAVRCVARLHEKRKQVLHGCLLRGL